MTQFKTQKANNIMHQKVFLSHYLFTQMYTHKQIHMY